jgi:hypothetical protein
MELQRHFLSSKRIMLIMLSMNYQYALVVEILRSIYSLTPLNLEVLTQRGARPPLPPLPLDLPLPSETIRATVDAGCIRIYEFAQCALSPTKLWLALYLFSLMYV